MSRTAEPIDIYRPVAVKTLPGLHEGLELVRFGNAGKGEYWLSGHFGAAEMLTQGPNVGDHFIVKPRAGWVVIYDPMIDGSKLVRAFDPPLRVKMEFEIVDSQQLERLQKIAENLEGWPKVAFISHPKEEADVKA